jgi:hypothetical protein
MINDGSSKQIQTAMKRNPLVVDSAESGPRLYYRDNSQIQFTSQLFPPSGDHDCSIRADFGEIFSHT